MKRRTVSATPLAGARASAMRPAASRIRADIIRIAPPAPRCCLSQTLRDPFPGSQSHTLTQAACRAGVARPPRFTDSRARAGLEENMIGASEIAYATALDLVELYRGKALSPVEATQALF